LKRSREEIEQSINESFDGKNINSALALKAVNGDINAFEKLIKYSDVSLEMDDKGNTLLHYAAKYGYLNLISLLINAGANPNAFNDSGKGPLDIAMKLKRTDIIEELIIRGAKIFNINRLLKIALSSDRPSLIKLLLDNDNKDDKISNGKKMKLMLISAAKNWASVVKTLIFQGVYKSVLNVDGFTPMDIATNEGSDDVIIALVKYGDKLIIRDLNEALIHSVTRNQLNLFKMLIDTEVNINVKDEDDDTVLQIAIDREHFEIAKLLIKLGAIDNEGNTPELVECNVLETNDIQPLSIDFEYNSNLWMLHEAIKYDQIDKATEILKNLTNKDLAFLKNNSDIIKLLIESDNFEIMLAFVEHNYPLTEDDLKSFLFSAISNDHIEGFKTIINLGIDINCKDDDDTTLLQYAIKKGNNKISELLIEAGANVNIIDKNGYTPLHYAVAYEWINVIVAALKNGANQNHLASSNYCTPTSLAIKSSKPEILSIFIEYGIHLDLETAKIFLSIMILESSIEGIEIMIDRGYDLKLLVQDEPILLYNIANCETPEIAKLWKEVGIYIDDDVTCMGNDTFS
jgi:ankyrin repeat protein